MAIFNVMTMASAALKALVKGDVTWQIPSKHKFTGYLTGYGDHRYFLIRPPVTAMQQCSSTNSEHVAE